MNSYGIYCEMAGSPNEKPAVSSTESRFRAFREEHREWPTSTKEPDMNTLLTPVSILSIAFLLLLLVFFFVGFWIGFVLGQDATRKEYPPIKGLTCSLSLT